MNSPIRVLIVDDEHYSRLELKHLLENTEHIQIVGEADNGEAAIMKALQLQPQVVFLDVEMPKMNGMETAKALTGFRTPPLIIFATAYPQFAAEAFQYEAIDYLLKPYDEARLNQALERVKKQVWNEEEVSESSKVAGKLGIETEGEIFYIHPHDIVYIHREENVTKIITDTNLFESKTALKEFEARLAPYCFFRIHKSIIVNLEYVVKLTPWFSGTYQLELKGKKEKLSVSRNYVKGLRTKMEL
ncbi:LytR/AlgR family response regulator transcription factor [Falsibacillus albus]|uniref:DNA-binding response regulator n=1 Tax=Falsibacillus albus TaxID=2478915 RepID=A0A3L7JY40_9BACI|nr:LytTR family DNA-binding domain-containing protein [Falsibacillus albus]RLQ93352.1 DNA-binding response regulator [Falsibacillus albus]